MNLQQKPLQDVWPPYCTCIQSSHQIHRSYLFTSYLWQLPELWSVPTSQVVETTRTPEPNRYFAKTNVKSKPKTLNDRRVSLSLSVFVFNLSAATRNLFKEAEFLRNVFLNFFYVTEVFKIINTVYKLSMNLIICRIWFKRLQLNFSLDIKRDVS